MKWRDYPDDVKLYVKKVMVLTGLFVVIFAGVDMLLIRKLLLVHSEMISLLVMIMMSFILYVIGKRLQHNLIRGDWRRER